MLPPGADLFGFRIPRTQSNHNQDLLMKIAGKSFQKTTLPRLCRRSDMKMCYNLQMCVLLHAFISLELCEVSTQQLNIERQLSQRIKKHENNKILFTFFLLSARLRKKGENKMKWVRKKGQSIRVEYFLFLRQN